MAKIGFLLGAGFSVPSGYPTAYEIRDSLFSMVYRNTRLMRFTDQRIYHITPTYPYNPFTNCWNDYHRDVFNQIWAEFDISGYEQMYQLFCTLEDDRCSVNYKKYAGIVSNLLINYMDKVSPIQNADDLVFIIQSFIIEIVFFCLGGHPIRSNPYHQVMRLLSTNDHTLHIATLNHDTSIEWVLQANHIPYSDGFNNACEFMNFWPTYPICVYKLHGSVDWFYRDYRLFKTGNLLRVSIDKSHGANDSVIAIGIKNKFNFYRMPFFKDIYSRFIDHASDLDLLVVIGYSEGDQYINQLVQKVSQKPTKQILYITADENISNTHDESLLITKIPKEDQADAVYKKIIDLLP